MKCMMLLVLSAFVSFGPLSAQTSSAIVVAKVDHLVYATPDLAAGIAAVNKLLGVRATPGGQHPGRGTRNALVSLGPDSYIEIIGPDPEQTTPPQPRPFGIDQLTAPRLVTWAAKANDLAGVSRRARTAGIALGPLADASRKRPDGVLLAWRYTDPRVVVADGVVPFFIDWGKTPHPAASAARGGTLVDLRAEHPDAEHVGAQLITLGLPLTVTRGARPALVASIETTRGRVELR